MPALLTTEDDPKVNMFLVFILKNLNILQKSIFTSAAKQTQIVKHQRLIGSKTRINFF